MTIRELREKLEKLEQEFGGHIPATVRIGDSDWEVIGANLEGSGAVSSAEKVVITRSPDHLIQGGHRYKCTPPETKYEDLGACVPYP